MYKIFISFQWGKIGREGIYSQEYDWSWSKVSNIFKHTGISNFLCPNSLWTIYILTDPQAAVEEGVNKHCFHSGNQRFLWDSLVYISNTKVSCNLSSKSHMIESITAITAALTLLSVMIQHRCSTVWFPLM